MPELIHVSGPSVEPVTSAEVKTAARIDGTEFDSQIALIIPAIRGQAEARLGRLLIHQVKELVLPAFPAGAEDLDLIYPDVASITSVTYLDVDGAPRTLDASAWELAVPEGRPARLVAAFDTEWPETQDIWDAVRIRFMAGYGPAGSAVPADVRLWILAQAVQVLRTPDGLGADNLKSLPYVDGLLDAHRILRAA